MSIPTIARLYCDGGVIQANPSPLGGTWATLRARFNQLVQQGASEDCWPWLGWKKASGYGGWKLERRTVLAHRVAYMLAHEQSIPPSMWVCHHCDNRICVNSVHLFLGTPADNTADMMAKGRNAYIIPVRYGEQHSQARLTMAQVQAIRKLLNEGMTHTVIAARFNVSRKTISKIAHGETWGWLK